MRSSDGLVGATSIVRLLVHLNGDNTSRVDGAFGSDRGCTGIACDVVRRDARDGVVVQPLSLEGSQ